MGLKLAYRGGAKSGEAAMAELVSYSGPISVDTETISLQDRTGIGIGLGTAQSEYYFQVLPECTEALPILAGILSDPRRTKVYFNALFDLRVLSQVFGDHNLPAPDGNNLHDASIMAQVQGRESNELDRLSEIYLQYSNPYSIKGMLLAARDGKRGATMLDIPFEAVALKNWYDTRQTLQLYELLQHGFQDEAARDCYEVDRQLIDMLLRMESPGLLLDHERLSVHYERVGREVLGYRNTFDEEGFNPDSPKQVGYILALRGNYLPFKNGRTLVTDEDALESCDDPLAKEILAYRKANKLLSTYIRPFLERDRAYTHFRIDLATGRLASGAFGKAHTHVCRNQQNIPNKMRDIYVPDSGLFSWMDFSQIEMRLLAFMSHDKEMMAAYREGRSIHEATMKALWPNATKKDADGYDTFEYLTAKTFNFAMAYYAMDSTLAKHTKLPIEVCADYKQQWLWFYNGAQRFMLERMADPSPVVVSDFGRRMRLPDLEEQRKRSEEAGNWFNERGVQNHINKCKINYKIQGTAADIIKRAMLQLKEVGGLRLQVHDELVHDGSFDWPDEFSSIHPDIPTPFEYHSGRIWQ